MIKLDDDLLQELGLASLPAEEKKKLLAHIYETLEMRVGMKLAEQMSDAQLTEFEQFIDRSDEAGARKWLETNFPNYKDVVAQEFENLKKEIREVAPQILAASNQQQAQVQAQSDVQAADAGADPVGQPIQSQQAGVTQPPAWQGVNDTMMQPQPQMPSSQPAQQFEQFGQPQTPQPPSDPWGGQAASPPPP
ncbi:hypothetical protein IRY61_01975, partial [Candidatus Saccharibacteria bacterium]|nr:hypothetical protein [Candidatus Saccharibacteria bacterium]